MAKERMTFIQDCLKIVLFLFEIKLNIIWLILSLHNYCGLKKKIPKKILLCISTHLADLLWMVMVFMIRCSILAVIL